MASTIIPLVVEQPDWVKTDAAETAGLDLLGLRLPVQVIGGELLNGITTITPTIRYLTLRTWLVHQYIHAPEPQPDTATGFVRFARAGEAAFVAANLVRDPRTLYLIGPEWASARLQENTAEIELDSLWKQRAVNTYANASDQLRLTENRGSAAPGLGVERGLPLAQAALESFGETAVGRQLRHGKELTSLRRQDINELAEIAWAGEIPDGERQCLIEAVIPPQPLPDEWSRVATYALLLQITKQKSGSPTEDDLFRRATDGAREFGSGFDPICDGWLRYAARDAIAVAGEAVLQGAVENLRDLGGRYGVVTDTAVVERMAANEAAHHDALTDVHVIDSDDNVAGMRFLDLERRVADATGHNDSAAPLKRWDAGLDEIALIRNARSRGIHGVSLLLLSWLLAERRAGAAAQSDDVAVEDLSFRGFERFGLKQVILPTLSKWRASNPTLAEVFGELVFTVVDQHLRTAWARMAVDVRKDVALIVRDGALWVHRKDYVGDRTASRITQAVGWLRQLKLIDAQGLTSDGSEVLQRARAILEVRT